MLIIKVNSKCIIPALQTSLCREGFKNTLLDDFLSFTFPFFVFCGALQSLYDKIVLFEIQNLPTVGEDVIKSLGIAPCWHRRWSEGVAENYSLVAEGLYSFPEVEPSTGDLFQQVTAPEGQNHMEHNLSFAEETADRLVIAVIVCW